MILLAAALTGGAMGACGNAVQLQPATSTNAVDTVTLYALQQTDVRLPSGFDLTSNAAVRTDLAAFDFAFDLDRAGEPLAYPAGALGLDRAPGILPATVLFDSLTSAPQTGYLDSLPVAIDPGTVFVVRSRSNLAGCELTGALPRYGKFRVLSVDPVSRSVKLQALVDQNCGYRSLEPGLPTT